MKELLALDRELFLFINGLSGGPLDSVFAWTTFLMTPLLFIFVLIFMFIWDNGKILRKFLLVLAMGAFGGLLLPQILKHLVDRPRPFNAFYDEIAQGKIVVNTFFQLYLSNSFPSGHSALVFSTAAALNFIYGRRLWFLYPAAALLAVTRVYVGAHFPGDVSAGALTGVFGAWIMYALMKRLELLK